MIDPREHVEIVGPRQRPTSRAPQGTPRGQPPDKICQFKNRPIRFGPTTFEEANRVFRLQRRAQCVWVMVKRSRQAYEEGLMAASSSLMNSDAVSTDTRPFSPRRPSMTFLNSSPNRR